MDAWSPVGENTPPQDSSTPATPTAGTIEFVSPPNNIDEYLDTFHDGGEVRFHTLDNIIGNEAAPKQAS